MPSMALCCRCATAQPTRVQVSKWAALGGRAFDREARLRDQGREAIVLIFPAALDKDATAPLRAAGFRFNKVLQHWEGLARFADAETLAKERGGAAHRVGPPAPPASAPALDTAAE